MLDPFLTEALSRLDAWLLEVCEHEEARARKLAPKGGSGWESVRDLARPASAELMFCGAPAEPLVPPGEHPLRRAQQALGLTPVEAEALLVLLSVHIEPRYRALYAVLQDNLQQPVATDRLLLTVLGGTIERRRTLLRSLGRSGRLMETGLVLAAPGAHAPLGVPLDLAEDTRDALLGFRPPQRCGEARARPHPPWSARPRRGGQWSPGQGGERDERLPVET
jgi:hypothetical protein